MATDTEGQQPTPHTITPHAEAGLDPHIKARDKFTLLPLRDYDGPIDDHDLDFSEPPVALSAEIPTLRPSGKIGNNTEIHARRTEALLKGSSAINKAFLVNAQKASRRLHSSVFPRELDLLTRTLTSLQQFAIVGAPNYGRSRNIEADHRQSCFKHRNRTLDEASAIFDHSSKAAQNRLGLNPSITPSPTYQARRFRNAHRDYYWDSDDSDSSSDDESSNARQENISRYSRTRIIPTVVQTPTVGMTGRTSRQQRRLHDAESADYGHDYHDDINASHDHSEADNSESSSDAESTSDRHDSHSDSYDDNSSDHNTGSSDNQSGSDSSENEY
ncbi:hypothetical protein B0H12DRAFT_1079078 [Mycena haematopus]|nr:hypothetical protein B0H12DRAFT_1079078 [Mycena haematopus]